jgi:hypothetical protein
MAFDKTLPFATAYNTQGQAYNLQSGVWYDANGNVAAVPPFNGPGPNQNPPSLVRNAVGQAIGLLGDNNATLPLSRVTTGNSIAILGNSVVAQGCVASYAGADASWAVGTSYTAATSYVSPSVQDLTTGYMPFRYQCTTSGTSGTVEPVFSKTVGGTVVDGTCVWTTVANASAIYWPQGWWHFAQGLSGQRLNEIMFVGRSGQQTPDILLYLPRVLAANPDIVFFANMWENDCGVGTPVLATITARWTAMVTAMDSVRAAGKRVMVQTCLPNGSIDASSAFTGYVRNNGTKAWQWINAQIRDYARARPDVIFFDASAVYVDPNIANPVWPENAVTYLSQAGAGQALKKTDGVHPYQSAAYLLAQALSPVLSANFPAVPHFGTAADLNYQSKNPLNFGTAGSSGANVGPACVPNSMTLNAYGTMVSATVAATSVARTDLSGNFLQFAYNATVGDNLDYNNGTTPLNNFAVGDVVQGFAEIKILANPVLLKQLFLRQDFSGTSLSSYSGTDIGSAAQDVGQFITADTLFTVKTVPMALPTGVTNVVQYARCYGRGAANFTAQFGRISLVRVNGNPALA